MCNYRVIRRLQCCLEEDEMVKNERKITIQGETNPSPKNNMYSSDLSCCIWDMHASTTRRKLKLFISPFCGQVSPKFTCYITKSFLVKNHQKNLLPIVRHDRNVKIWPCFSSSGPRKCHIVQRIMNSGQYCKKPEAIHCKVEAWQKMDPAAG